MTLTAGTRFRRAFESGADMNQPASKEPTMDEILSSIRQIIADDDEAAAQKMPVAKAGPKPVAAQPEPVPAPVDIDPFGDDEDDVVEPLALSPEQIVEETPVAAPEPVANFAVESPSAPAELVVPDDVAFEQDRDPEPQPAFKPASFAQAAPMPDPDLSSALADELLEPATSAAVRSAFSKLNAPKLTPDLPLGASGLTIEAMIREMLRPMLKDWLEENLPAMVERIVAQEIERVSRGG